MTAVKFSPNLSLTTETRVLFAMAAILHVYSLKIVIEPIVIRASSMAVEHGYGGLVNTPLITSRLALESRYNRQCTPTIVAAA